MCSKYPTVVSDGRTRQSEVVVLRQHTLTLLRGVGSIRFQDIGPESSSSSSAMSFDFSGSISSSMAFRSFLAGLVGSKSSSESGSGSKRPAEEIGGWYMEDIELW